MAVRGRGIVLSLVLSVASLGALAWPGLNTGIDFQGGVAMEVHTPATIDTLRGGLAASGLEGSLQRFGDDGQYLLRLPAGADSDARIEAAKAALSAVSPEAGFPRLDVVGPSVSGGFVETSILAVLLAGAGMLVYLRLRFAPHFAWAALITLGLDLSKTLGFLVLTGLEFNLTTVAALADADRLFGERQGGGVRPHAREPGAGPGAATGRHHRPEPDPDPAAHAVYVADHLPGHSAHGAGRWPGGDQLRPAGAVPVSYTHLTLPTILRV